MLRAFACLLLSAVVSAPAWADDLVLEKGDRLAIIGDSITEQKLYSVFIESYLLACYPELEIQTFQFGWGGERAPGFAARMENDLVPWQPDVVTTCYGMNDGSYRAYEEQIGKVYEDGMRKIIDRMKREGATLVVGSPGVVDSFTWQRGNPDFDQVYNDNLERLGMIAAKLAEENEMPHADVFHTMLDAMKAAKAKLGEEYAVAGGDGVHPGANGHLLMACAFLKALGFDGQIGTVTVDLSTGKTEASSGHKVLNANGGTVELESSRYPFCYAVNAAGLKETIPLLPFTSFDEDLNRFELKVTGLKSESADVTFGSETKTFTREQLESGINLASEFLQNPFVGPFEHLVHQVWQKQAFETTMIKSIVTNFRQIPADLANDPEVQQSLKTLREKLTAADDAAHQKAKAAVQPVKYTITVNARD